MFNIKQNLKIFAEEVKNFDQETLIYEIFPQFTMALLSKYLRVEIEGLENVPDTGSALITPNHSGFAGLDAMLLSHFLKHRKSRLPKILTHRFWFLTRFTSLTAKRFGFIRATKSNGVSSLLKDHLVVLFPEGEHGNFKPSTRAYKLQEFRRGFVRMALQTGAPIIPTLIIGAEETHINLSQLKLGGPFKNSVIPLPLNIVPLPAKWKIKFLKPVYLPYKPEAANDRELVREVASDLREKLQRAINEEVQSRGTVFI